MTKIKEDPRIHLRKAIQPMEKVLDEIVAEVKKKTPRSKASDTKKAPKSKRRS